MAEMSVIWLRVAAAFYSLGLLHAILTLVRRRELLFADRVCGTLVHRGGEPAVSISGARAEEQEAEQVLLPAAAAGDSRRIDVQVHDARVRADYARGDRRQHLGLHRIEGGLDPPAEDC